MLYKEILGAVAVVVGLIGYAPYIRDVLRGTTKPHLFSWLLWGVIEITAFIAQVQKGAGPGSWVTAVSALFVCFIAYKAMMVGEKNITTLDWLGFAGAFLGIIAWIFTQNPTGAVIIITITDACAFIPTYRKGYQRPDEETITEFGTSSAKHAIGLLAIKSYNIATSLYPASLVLTNGVFTIMVWLRRKKLAKVKGL
jgi:drug/metabolite transporter superfamily protein YnfA